MTRLFCSVALVLCAIATIISGADAQACSDYKVFIYPDTINRDAASPKIVGSLYFWNLKTNALATAVSSVAFEGIGTTLKLTQASTSTYTVELLNSEFAWSLDGGVTLDATTTKTWDFTTSIMWTGAQATACTYNPCIQVRGDQSANSFVLNHLDSNNIVSSTSSPVVFSMGISKPNGATTPGLSASTLRTYLAIFEYSEIPIARVSTVIAGDAWQITVSPPAGGWKWSPPGFLLLPVVLYGGTLLKTYSTIYLAQSIRIWLTPLRPDFIGIRAFGVVKEDPKTVLGPLQMIGIDKVTMSNTAFSGYDVTHRRFWSLDSASALTSFFTVDAPGSGNWQLNVVGTASRTLLTNRIYQMELDLTQKSSSPRVWAVPVFVYVVSMTASGFPAVQNLATIPEHSPTAVTPATPLSYVLNAVISSTSVSFLFPEATDAKWDFEILPPTEGTCDTLKRYCAGDAVDIGYVTDAYRLKVASVLVLDYEYGRSPTAFDGMMLGLLQLTHTSPDFTVTRSISLTLTDINEAPTGVTPNVFSIDENADPQTLGTISPVDPDAKDKTGLIVSIATAADRFAITSSGGVYSLATKLKLDYEDPRVINGAVTFSVEIVDASANRWPFPVTVYINNINEKPTAVDITVASGLSTGINENLASPIKVATLILRDPDGDCISCGTATFSITSGATDFEIRNGYELWTLHTFDYEALPAGNKKVSLSVVGTDAGGLATNGNTFSFNILNVNDPPRNLRLAPNSLSENVAGGTLIGTLIADDDDNDKLTYTIDPTLFDVKLFNPQAPRLLTLSTFDYESVSIPLKNGKKGYTVRASAKDASVTTTEDIFVEILNVNEVPTNIELVMNAAIGDDSPMYSALI
eukprot:Opistho-2@46439